VRGLPESWLRRHYSPSKPAQPGEHNTPPENADISRTVSEKRGNSTASSVEQLMCNQRFQASSESLDSDRLSVFCP